MARPVVAANTATPNVGLNIYLSSANTNIAHMVAKPGTGTSRYTINLVTDTTALTTATTGSLQLPRESAPNGIFYCV